jgi:hypothetical protein
MCTNNLKPVKGSLVGWKVVVVWTQYSKKITSPIYSLCRWTPNTTKHNSEKCYECSFHGWREGNICLKPVQECVIHCFATRKQARWYKRNVSDTMYQKHKIIKLVLTCAYKGVHSGMYHEGEPAHCGRHAYWDGKFHT